MGILDKLEGKVEDKVMERIGPLEKKMDTMIEKLDRQIELLEKIAGKVG